MKEDPVARFSVSMPAELLSELDEMVAAKGYDNRSLAIADMVRDELVQHRAHGGRTLCAATITLVFDHHKSHVQQLLTSLQHDHPGLVLAALHVHLDHDNCLEVLVARGPTRSVKRMADRLIGAKGVKHGRLTLASTGDLPG